MPMFHYTEKTIAKTVFQFQLKHQDKWLTVGQVVDLWRHSIAFRNFYTQIFREVPFFGFFWENRPMSRQSLMDTYQFIVAKTMAFHGTKADSSAFEAHFEGPSMTTVFPNLSQTAQLVVPCPSATYPDGFAHMGCFIRKADDQQLDAFWRLIGQTLHQHFQVSEAPIWLSTSGLGVPWLHVRLDQTPKYYTFEPYKHYQVLS